MAGVHSADGNMLRVRALFATLFTFAVAPLAVASGPARGGSASALAAGSAMRAARIQSARKVRSIPSVGPLFPANTLAAGPGLAVSHFCSASVVHSASHDLVLTAAHCVRGSGRGIQFAPGFHDGISPRGVWSVRRAYLDARWRRDRDPQHDFAVLDVAPRNGNHVEDGITAARLGAAPAPGTSVTVDGYVAGRGGEPITCAAPVYYTRGYPSFDCAGYAGGVSGGPWLTGGHVVGVIGGLHEGGCTPSTSYSSDFLADVAALLTRAERGGPGDVMLLTGGDGC
jgi:V8-like Glu-specific endopeptidase